MAEAGYYPGSSMFLNQWITGAEFGQAYSILTLGSCTSGIIGGPLAILFLSLDSVAGLRGWQWLFLVEGIPTVLLGLLFPFVVPRSPSHAAWLTPAEARWLEARALASAREKPGHSTKAPTWRSSAAAVKAAATNWRVWYLGLVHMCGLCSYYGILFWGPLLVREIVHGGAARGRNVDPKVIGLSMVPYAVASVALTWNAWHSRRTREVRWHAVVPLTTAACALAALGPLAQSGHKGLAIVALVVATAGSWADHGPRATMWEGLMAGESQAAAFAIINSLGNVGGFIVRYALRPTTSRPPSLSAWPAPKCPLLRLSPPFRPSAPRSAAGAVPHGSAPEGRGGQLARHSRARVLSGCVPKGRLARRSVVRRQLPACGE